jgi:hypothetical protein
MTIFRQKKECTHLFLTDGSCDIEKQILKKVGGEDDHDHDHDNNNNNNNNNNLTIEIQRMWNVKTRVIPVIIGAIGTISKSFRK